MSARQTRHTAYREEDLRPECAPAPGGGGRLGGPSPAWPPGLPPVAAPATGVLQTPSPPGATSMIE